MAPTEQLRPSVPSAMADLRDVPLAEMPALGLELLGRTVSRALPDPVATAVPVAAFQSSI